MHCIRLLRSGLEILRNGEIIVDRRQAGDIADLKAIRDGDYSYSDVMKMAEDLVAENGCCLPKNPLYLIAPIWLKLTICVWN